jgi:hypothetical protein
MSEHRSCSVKKNQFEIILDTDKLKKKGSKKKHYNKKRSKRYITNEERQKTKQKACGDIDQEIHVT